MKTKLKFKDKIYQDYFIDENGVIYDLEGNEQPTYIKQGRPTFKKIRYT